MNVKIASCYFMSNYGSILQAYALQKYLEDQGISVENICVDGIKKKLDSAKIRYFIREIKDFSVILNKFGRVKKAIRKKIDKSYRKTMAKRAKEIDRFRTQYISISPMFNSEKEIGEYVASSDAVIVGSDQLWLPSNIYAGYYTLDFVSDKVNKISYATSFGVSSLPDNFKNRTKFFLSRFTAISSREDTGKTIVNGLGLDCALVCDPTLLLEKKEWYEAIPDKQRIIEPYIFCYFLGTISEHRELAKRIREETGYKIVALVHCEQYSKCDYGYANITPYDVGPDDFINLIKHASIVLTDSFHGTCFSIIFEREFYSFLRHKDNETLSTNSRIYSLASILGFGDRVIPYGEINNIDITKKVDYLSINSRLDEFRMSSRKYLMEAIEGKGE